MVDNDDDFDSMLEDCALNLDTKLEAEPKPQIDATPSLNSEAEPPAMQLQSVAASESVDQASQSVEEPATKINEKAGAGGDDEEEVKQALEDFQNSLKDVLKDDGSAEQAMKDMEQMMGLLKQSIDQASKGAAPGDIPQPQRQQPAAAPAEKQATGKTFLQQMLDNCNAQTGQTPAAETQPDANTNPFASSASQMFNDFERAKTEMPTNANPSAQQSAAGGVPPGMNDADLEGFEKQFTGLFSNIVKQMESLDGDEDEDDEELTEEEKREAESMMKNLFGAMGMDPATAGQAMPGMGMGMGAGGGMPQQDFGAQMNQFEEMFKSMGMQMDGSDSKNDPSSSGK